MINKGFDNFKYSVYIRFIRNIYAMFSVSFRYNSQVTPGFQGFPQIWGKSKFSIWGNPPDLGEFTFFNH